MKRTLHVRTSTPNDVVLCELGQSPLQLFWRKMLLQYIARLSDLPGERLVKKAFTHAQDVKTPWFQGVSKWLVDNHFDGLLRSGTFSVSDAVSTLRQQWLTTVCQSTSSKTQFYIDSMYFDSDQIAPYLNARPSPAMFAFIKFRLGSHRLRVELDRWVVPKPPREQRICRHCDSLAAEDEAHFLFDCPLYNTIRDNHSSLFGHDHGNIRLFLERNVDRMPSVAHYIHLCFQARRSNEPHLAPHGL